MKMPQKIKDPFILLPFLLGVSLFIISSCSSAVDPVVIPPDLTASGITITDCPSDQTGTLLAGATEVAVSWTAATATDSNGVTIAAASIVSSPTSGSDFSEGTTVVLTTVTDTAGNEDTTCTFTVTAAALTQAGITIIDCPSDQTVTLLAGATTVVATWTAPTATDSNGVTIDPASIVSTSTSGSDFSEGTTVVLTTVTDTAGNEDTTCTFTVTAAALTQAGITIIDCPSDQTGTLLAGATEVAVSWTAPTATDSNGVTIDPASIVSSPASGSDFSKGATVVTTTVTDTAGNEDTTCTFTVTAAALTQAGITVMCPSDITRTLAAGATTVFVRWTAATATDSNGATIAAASIVSSPASGSTFTLGDTVVTTTVTDTAGNEDTTCTFTVEVVTVTVTCPDDITKNVATAGDPAVAVMWAEAAITASATASDGSTTSLFGRTHAPGGTFPIDSSPITVTYVYENTAGITGSCTFTVTVTDV